MVKLIRLATTNEDAVFRANFDTDIILNENAQIAVRHCYFQNDDIIFRPTETSGKIITKVDVSDDDPSGTSDGITNIVEEGVYRFLAKNTINQAITNALNTGCNVRNDTANGGATYQNNPIVNGSSFQCRQSILNENFVQLCYRYSPNTAFHPEFYAENYNLNNGEKVYSYIANRPLPGAPDGHIVSADLGREISIPIGDGAVVFNNTQKYRMVAQENIGLCKGSSYFHAQIKYDNGLGDGFGMGIAFTPKVKEGEKEAFLSKYDTTHDTLPDDVRTMEIFYTNLNTAYTFRLNGVETITSHNPSADNADANSALHDVILFRLVNVEGDGAKSLHKKWQGVIVSHNSGNGSEEIIFERDVLTEELEMNWQPYIWVLEKDNRLKIQDVIWTPDPFLNGENFALDKDQTIFPSQDVAPVPGSLSAGIIKFLPHINPYRSNEDIESRVLLSRTLERLIGFKQNHNSVLNFTIGDDECKIEPFAENAVKNYIDHQGRQLTFQQQGWQIQGLDHVIFDVNDYYIIETLGLPLNSYNSSEDAAPSHKQEKLTFWNTDGARVNILDTIPFINEQGLVVYSPSELLYVDILNSNKQNLRNLKVRILDQYRNPIKLVGKAEILLVIKDA